MSISAKIICDSISPQGVRLTTLELCYPRFIHSEAKTHRIISLDDEEYEIVLKQKVDLMDDPMLSRNASSSRAIPIEKMIKQVRENPAMPIHWGKNQPGMQAREECSNPILSRLLGFDLNRWDRDEWWELLAEQTAEYAVDMALAGYHKQIVNRLLEPFQWMKVIVTATEFDNFFKLRLHTDAQPEIQELARCMKKAMEESTPVELEPGEWHLPFLTEDEQSIANPDECLEDAIKWSVARCARVSYLNHDNTFPDREKDIALADKLLEAGHMSPMEHQGTPMDIPWDNKIRNRFPNNGLVWEKGVTHLDRKGKVWSSNFKGWIQYRNVL